jgi:hypothetical protein
MEANILGYIFRIELILLALGFIILICCALLGGTCDRWHWRGMTHGGQGGGGGGNHHYSSREGFTPANTNYGESSSYTLGQIGASKPETWGTADMMVTPGTTTWGQPNLTVQQGQPASAQVQAILNRPEELPLPKGELVLFANTEFKPECCPGAFSSSTGCACMNPKTYNYLVERGGNNIPYSEY